MDEILYHKHNAFPRSFKVFVLVFVSRQKVHDCYAYTDFFFAFVTLPSLYYVNACMHHLNRSVLGCISINILSYMYFRFKLVEELY